MRTWRLLREVSDGAGFFGGRLVVVFAFGVVAVMRQRPVTGAIVMAVFVLLFVPYELSPHARTRPLALRVAYGAVGLTAGIAFVVTLVAAAAGDTISSADPLLRLTAAACALVMAVVVIVEARRATKRTARR